VKIFGNANRLGLTFDGPRDLRIRPETVKLW